MNSSIRKIGLIVECGPKGADLQVLSYFIHQIESSIEVQSVALDNKDLLIKNCGEAARNLLNQGCQRVLIVWDLYPPWRENAQGPCQKEDRDNIYKFLKDLKKN